MCFVQGQTWDFAIQHLFGTETSGMSAIHVHSCGSAETQGLIAHTDGPEFHLVFFEDLSDMEAVDGGISE